MNKSTGRKTEKGLKSQKKKIKIDETKIKNCSFEIAGSAEDYFDALQLVQEVYQQEGYVSSCEKILPFRILENHFYDKTTVFIGKKENSIIFTVSLFPDTSSGLPMDMIYREELDRLRLRSRHIGEVGCLATHPEVRDGSQNIVMHGNKIMFNYAMKNLKLDDLVISVHPKHVEFYREVLMFEPMGKVKTYPRVNNMPAEALRLDLHGIEEKFRKFYSGSPPGNNLHEFFFKRKSRVLNLPERNRIFYNDFRKFIEDRSLEGLRK